MDLMDTAAAALLSPTSSMDGVSSTSLMMIAQQFFQQQSSLHQQQESVHQQDSADDLLMPSFPHREEEEEQQQRQQQQSMNLMNCWNMINSQQQQQGCGGAQAQLTKCGSSSVVEEDITAYLDGFTPPATPPHQEDHQKAHSKQQQEQTEDWMEYLMMSGCIGDGVEAEVATGAAAEGAAEEESSHSSELFTPDDVWREHFGLNLVSSSRCSGDQQWDMRSFTTTTTSAAAAAAAATATGEGENSPDPDVSANLRSQQQQQQQRQVQDHHGKQRLERLLVSCVEDMESGQEAAAAEKLAALKSMANPGGSAVEKCASYFSSGLEARLDLLQERRRKAGKGGAGQQQIHGRHRRHRGGDETKDLPSSSSSSSSPPSPPSPPCSSYSMENKNNMVEPVAMAYKTLTDSCPYLKFAHLTANQALLEATDGAASVHIVDYGTMQGVQWAAFLQAFATWPSKNANSPRPRRSLRITGIPSPYLGPNPAAAMLATQRRLTDFARLLDIDFHFCPILEPIHDFQPWRSIQFQEDEVVAVNFVLQLAQIPLQALQRAFALVRRLNPRIVTVAEYEVNGGVTVVDQLTTNARFYCAVMESMDATVPRDDPQRMEAESVFIAEEIRRGLVEMRSNSEVVERQREWQRCIDGAGLWNASLSHYSVSQAKLLLWLYDKSDCFTLAQGPGSLSLGWLGTSIVTVSAWHC